MLWRLWACGWTTARPTRLRGHDQRLLRLLPALADSVLAPPIRDNEPPLLLLAPPVDEFLRQNAGFAGYSVRDVDGKLLLGDAWVHSAVPTTQAPEFHSVEFGGVTYRVAVLRGRTGAGEPGGGAGRWV